MKKAVLVSLLLFASCLPAIAATSLWQAWLYVSDDRTITVAWDEAGQGVVYYEVQMQALYPDQFTTVRVNAPLRSATFTKTRTGLHRFQVRGCASASLCSAWTGSDGPNGQVLKPDGQALAQPWVVFFRPSPVIIK